MIIYIDNDYKCYVSNDGTMREFDVPFFDGKCPEFIEGYRHIPEGETWTGPDGTEYSGTSPWKDYDKLHMAQLEYELEQTKAELADAEENLADADAALAILGVTADE